MSALQVLLTWIEEGVITPHRDDEGYMFDQVDKSRVALACDLHYRMGLDHASLPVILSLIDQLHDVWRHLRALTHAVAEQPEAVRQEIAERMAGSRPPTSSPGRATLRRTTWPILGRAPAGRCLAGLLRA